MHTITLEERLIERGFMKLVFRCHVDCTCGYIVSGINERGDAKRLMDHHMMECPSIPEIKGYSVD